MANSTSGTIGAFLGGALLGFTAAVLFAPMKGSDLRQRIKDKLREHSIILSDLEVEELIARLEADDEEL
ncbi:MAG: YtxH domain-containing protein [Bacteroidales bacterium]|nr:YtxH domain-containing protein [Bacteroidales bacterium]